MEHIEAQACGLKPPALRPACERPLRTAEAAEALLPGGAALCVRRGMLSVAFGCSFGRRSVKEEGLTGAPRPSLCFPNGEVLHPHLGQPAASLSVPVVPGLGHTRSDTKRLWKYTLRVPHQPCQSSAEPGLSGPGA